MVVFSLIFMADTKTVFVYNFVAPLILRKKTLERSHWCLFVFIINCEYISYFVLIVDSERANVSWVHIEKTNTFEDKIGYIMRYVCVF